MERALRIIIIGANLCNRGAESMLLTLMSSIQPEIGDAHFTVWSYAGDDRPRCGTITHSDPNGINLKFELAYNYKGLGLLLLQGLLLVAPFAPLCRLAGRLSSFVRDVHEANAVIDISGFALTGDRPWWRHIVYALEAGTAYACNTPFLAMTQSFGPFRNRWQKQIAKLALAHAGLISARGETSANNLESIGLSRAHDFIIAPDMSYLFEPAPAQLAHELLQQSPRPRIAVIPNTNVYHQSYRHSKRNGCPNAYLTSMREICQSAIDELDCHIVFIPHERYPSRFDDFALVNVIRDDPTIQGNSTVLDSPLTASTLKSVITQCDAVITSRYHGMLAALSGAVPAFVLGWAEKYEESAAMAGSSEFTFNFNQTDPDFLVQRFRKFWECRAITRQALLERLSGNHAEAKHAMNAMVEKLRSHSDQ